MKIYLITNYVDEIINLINDSNDRSHISLHIDLGALQQQKFEWFVAILNNAHTEAIKWDTALLEAQKQICQEHEHFLEPNYQIKVKCHIRFVGLPPPDPRYKLPFPNYAQVGKFRELRGNVARITQTKLLELKRDFICSKCKIVKTVEADYILMHRFEAPRNCEKVGCKGNMNQKSPDPTPEYCVYYQEIRVQDITCDTAITSSIIVTLDNDLTDSCQPGDSITICGTIERRWLSFQYDGNVRAEIAMRANSLVREQHHLNADMKYFSEQMALMEAEWSENVRQHGEATMRDNIVRSICPEVYGMYPVKLGIALAICSGHFDAIDNSKPHQRGHSHVLMIGDPGLAKSKLLENAVSIAPRGVHTTGMGCSSAGLTAAAIKEEGEWILEAGALVLSDGGICCIDEFNRMSETDRTSIHEAMEQQTISMAKAGIVCKLNTRCAVIAGANPRDLKPIPEIGGINAINIGIDSPLLSRFDLVFILRDERLPEWDDIIARHILSQAETNYKKANQNEHIWSVQKLQSHFAGICRFKPKMSAPANHIISKYYQRCRDDPQRDYSRTTARLIDSLNRLAEAHARLLLRNTITLSDAVVVIRLMESTHGFGRTNIKRFDVIKEDLPLGPSKDEIREVCNALDPNFVITDEVDNEDQVMEDSTQSTQSKTHYFRDIIQQTLGTSISKTGSTSVSETPINNSNDQNFTCTDILSVLDSQHHIQEDSISKKRKIDFEENQKNEGNSSREFNYERKEVITSGEAINISHMYEVGNSNKVTHQPSVSQDTQLIASQSIFTADSGIADAQAAIITAEEEDDILKSLEFDF